MATGGSGRLAIDAKELVLNSDDRFVCETYIFEPTKQEEELGYLFAVGEIEDRGGVGRELLELTMGAIQKEYYRDVRRGAASSFELALHQANLILHDSAEGGVKDWMGYFHVAVCVLVGTTLHVGVAGQGSVTLARKGTLVEVSEGLATYPVTNPLRTFSQVATGEGAARDVLYLGTANFRPLFRGEDLKRFAIDHSANTIATRLNQLYTDHGLRHPMAALVVSLLPTYVVSPTPLRESAAARGEAMAPLARRRAENIHQASLTPRQPIVLKRSWPKVIILILARVLAYGWSSFKQTFVPAAKRAGGQALQLGGQARKSGVALIQTGKGWQRPRLSPGTVMAWVGRLPRSSKIFAILAVFFAIALVVSLVLLRAKRAEDARIQQASEQLHAARTAKDAADAALIYDNREQAEKLLGEARDLTAQLRLTGLYQEEVAKLERELAVENDRVQKIFRVSGDSVRTVGDWSQLIATARQLKLFVIGEDLYTFHPDNNAILKMQPDGASERVTQTTEGIGFFSHGVVQAADKTIVLLTDSSGVALFDSKDNLLLKQDLQLPSEQSRLEALSVFGSRLYAYDAASANVYLYNKTLRGYAGGTPWITDNAFPKDSIRSLAIDGNMFTLHNDGQIRRLFKGAAAEFTMATIEPSLSGATRLISGEEYQYLYVVDPPNRRVVVLTKEGELVRQVLIENAANMQDAAIGPEEDTLYVLNGTQVVAVSLSPS